MRLQVHTFAAVSATHCPLGWGGLLLWSWAPPCAISASKPWVLAGSGRARDPIGGKIMVVWHEISFSRVAFVQGGKFWFLRGERFGLGDSAIIEFQ